MGTAGSTLKARPSVSMGMLCARAGAARRDCECGGEGEGQAPAPRWAWACRMPVMKAWGWNRPGSRPRGPLGRRRPQTLGIRK